jgi:hypothetical protein
MSRRNVEVYNLRHCASAPLRDNFVDALAIEGIYAPAPFDRFSYRADLCRIASRMPRQHMMRECEERAKQQKIKMEDRARFVDECIAAGVK